MENLEIYLDYIGDDSYVYRYNYNTKKYYNTGICLKGSPGNPGRPGRNGDSWSLKDVDGTYYWFKNGANTGIPAQTNGGAPTNLARVAETGSYNDLTDKPTIPTVPTNVSAFTNDAGYLTQHQDISGKQNTLVSGTNIKTINNESILGSGNINIDISGKEDVTTIVAPVNTTDATLPITTLTTEIGKYYRIDVPIETLAITLPAMGVVTSIKTVVIYLTGGTTPAVTILSTAPTGGTAPDVYFSKDYAIEAGKTYEVNCLWNGDAWIVASVEIVVTNNGGE